MTKKSSSYHATFSQLKGTTKKQLNVMPADPDSILSELATKLHVKKSVRKKKKSIRFFKLF